MNNLEKYHMEIQVNLNKIQTVFKNPYLLHTTDYLKMWVEDEKHGKYAKETLDKTLRKLKTIGLTEYEFNNVVEYLSEN